MDKRFSGTHGFTMVELLTVLAVVAILASIALSQYTSYLDKARKTVSINMMSAIRQQMEHYYTDYDEYPDDFNLTTCTDPAGNRILTAYLCSQALKDVYSLDSYTIVASDYTLTARAKDSAHTVITITKTSITY